MATDVTDATFETEVLESGEPVLVDFWAEWCGPCHAVSPVLERIAEERNLKLVKVNIDENQELALRYGIQSIPNMILFENGQPKANAIGAMPKGMLEKQLARIELLAGLPGETIATLAKRMDRQEVAPGTAIMYEGEPGDRFYVVFAGMLSVSQRDRGNVGVL